MTLDISYSQLENVLDRLLTKTHGMTDGVPAALRLDDALLELETCQDILTGDTDYTLDQVLRSDPVVFELARSALDAALVVSNRVEDGLIEGFHTQLDILGFNR
jgi:hypothetical protein